MSRAAVSRLGIFALLLLSAIGSQVARDAYRSEVAAYPDEPSHVVTSILFERYVLDGFPVHPMRYAEDYYLHYPKVAVGHWPPLLYAVHGVGLLVGGVHRTTFLLVQALLAALLGMMILACWGASLRAWMAAVAGMMILWLPILSEYTSMVMAEILLVLLMLVAAVALARLAEANPGGDRMKWAALFAAAAVGAVYTKGTGLVVILATPVFLVLAGQWKLLLDKAFWLAVIVIGVFCGPLQLLTQRMATVGFTPLAPTWEYLRQSALDFTVMYFSLSGVALTLLAVAGFVWELRRGAERGARLRAISLLSLVVVSWAFHIAVPAGIETRKMLPGLVGILAMAGLGARALAGGRRWVAEGLMVLALVPIPLLAFPVSRKFDTGMLPLIDRVYRETKPETGVLIASESYGEGTFIAEFALRDPRPKSYLLRSTKLLASMGWSGDNYRMRASNGNEVIALLESAPVSLIVLDERSQHVPHIALLRDALAQHADVWELVSAEQVAGNWPGQVKLYRNRLGQRPVIHVIGDVTEVLGRKIERQVRKP